MKLTGPAAKRFLAAPDRSVRAALFFGPNRSAVTEASEALVRGLLGPSPDAFALVRLDEEAVRKDRARLWDELAAQSLLGGDRLARLKVEGDSAADTILAALADLEAGEPAAAFLLVEAGDLSQRSKIRTAFEHAVRAVVGSFYEDDHASLTELAMDALAHAKVRLTPDARALLETALPTERGLLRSEIEKIIVFAGAGAAPVDATALVALLAVEEQAALDDATAAAAAGRAGDAVEALSRSAAQGVSAMRALERRLLRLMEARVLVDGGASPTEAAQKLRPPVFWKEREAFGEHLRTWSVGALAGALDALWRAQLRAMTAGAPQDLIAADAFRTAASFARRR